MPRDPDSSIPTIEPERLRLIGLVSSHWSALEHDMATVLTHMAGIAAPVARAIMLTIKANDTRRTVLKNVAIVRPCTEWQMIQLGRVLTEISGLAERYDRLTGNDWYTAFPDASGARQDVEAGQSENRPVVDNDLSALAADVARARENIAQFVNLLTQNRPLTPAGP